MLSHRARKRSAKGFIIESSGASSGCHTQIGWEVDDIGARVAEFRGRGVVFEEYNLPGLTTVYGIADRCANGSLPPRNAD
jgi:hypothetical protein